MARDFTGASFDRIVYAHRAVLDGAAQLAISLWVRTDTNTGGWASIVQQIGANTSGTGLTSGFLITPQGTQADKMYLFVRNNSAESSRQIEGLSTTDWNHVLWQYDGSEGTATNRIRVWLNGSVPTTSYGGGDATTIGTCDQPIQLSNSGDGWDGAQAEVAIWAGVVLDAGQRAALAAGYAPHRVRRDGLIFYAPLIRDTQDLIGGAATSTSGTTAAGHPRMLYGRAARGMAVKPAGAPVGNRRRRLLLCGR